MRCSDCDSCFTDRVLTVLNLRAHIQTVLTHRSVAGVVVIGLLLLTVWYIALGFNAGMHANANNLQCDKPLATFVLLAASFMVASVVMQIMHSIWYGELAASLT